MVASAMATAARVSVTCRVSEPCAELADPTFWDRAGGDASKYGSMKGFAELSDLLWESRKA